MDTDSEQFASIRIDSPKPLPASGSAAAPRSEPRSWRSFFGFGAKERPRRFEAFTPAPDATYRMAPLADLLRAADLHYDPAEAYLDDYTVRRLRASLGLEGLALAIDIRGPLRLRVADTVPVVRSPLIPNRSSISLGVYIFAWLLQADAYTRRDLDIADSWIASFPCDSAVSSAMQGTLRWLLSRRLAMTARRKRRLATLAKFPVIRKGLQAALLSLVASPDDATQKRMKRLAAVYQMIGLDPADIHADIHRLSTAGTTTPAPAKTGKLKLDSALLQQMQQNTDKAHTLLADVFAEPTGPAEDAENAREGGADHCNDIRQIIATLARRDSWPTAEVRAIAEQHNLTLGSLLERINDYAYDHADDAVAEHCGSSITIDPEIASLCLD